MTQDNKPDPINDPQTYSIIGAAMEVHRHLGCGFLEAAYRKPLEFEFADRHIPFETEVSFPIMYKGKPTGVRYRVDFVCFGDIIVEIKSQKALTPVDEAQGINYLKVAKYKRGLLLNFGTTSLQFKRLAN